ncbi:MAG: methylated-DNA--[protein]-cysteine S-methyltransferase [Pirellula sp.]
MTSANENKIYFTLMDSPIGELLLHGSADWLAGLYIMNQKHSVRIAHDWLRSEDIFQVACDQLREYFAGARFEFDLVTRSEGTEFQQRVWTELTKIPYGRTCSYGELAARLGNPNASRAVGLANGRNPISIIVPCHRVIGANGSLTGYGGGLEAKKWLLGHEATMASTMKSATSA